MDDVGTSAMDWESAESSADDDDDEVIDEVDVFISMGQADSLYLLQYPLRPADHSLSLGTEQGHDIACEFKPKQEKLQIKLPLDASSSSYDKSRGEQIAINCGASSSSATTSKNKTAAPFEKMMDYQNLVSSNVGGFHQNCYAVGYCKNGQLHLAPMRNILQMRPSFSYLDSADAKSSKTSGGGAQADAGDSSQDESETEAGTSGAGQLQTVRVKFKEESEYARKRREASYQYQQKLKDEEAWIPLQYVPETRNEVLEERTLLLGNVVLPTKPDEEKDSPETQSAVVAFGHEAPRLLRLLVPKAEEQKIQTPKLPSTVIPLNQLRGLPLPDQVRTLMTNVKLLRFSQLLSLLPPKVDTNIVLKNLHQYAQLVKGCWVVKSDILYPKGSFSPRTGASADLLCLARDYAMYRFTQVATLTRREIAHAVKLPTEDIDDILHQLARFKVQTGWHFMYPPDAEFIQKHPDIAQQQAAKWEAKFKELSQHLTQPRQRNLSSSMGSPTPDRRRRTDSGRNSMTESGGDETGLMSPPPTTSAGARSRRRSSSGQGTANVKNSTKTPSASSTAQNHNGLLHDPMVGVELKNFLYDAFCTKSVLTLAKIVLLMKVKLSESPKNHPLTKCTDPKLIEDCAIQMGTSKFEKAQGENAERTVLVFPGGSWPEVRSFLIRYLHDKSRGKKEKATFRFNAFKDALITGLSPDYSMPSDTELKQLVNEYCLLKSGGYYHLSE